MAGDICTVQEYLVVWYCAVSVIRGHGMNIVYYSSSFDDVSLVCLDLRNGNAFNRTVGCKVNSLDEIDSINKRTWIICQVHVCPYIYSNPSCIVIILNKLHVIISTLHKKGITTIRTIFIINNVISIQSRNLSIVVVEVVLIGNATTCIVAGRFNWLHIYLPWIHCIIEVTPKSCIRIIATHQTIILQRI